MLQITILLSVAALWAFAVVSPGPNFLVTARLGMACSRRAAMQAVCGIILGTICWAAAGCFGVRTLFIAAPWMYALIKASDLFGVRGRPTAVEHLAEQGSVPFAAYRRAAEALAFSAWAFDDSRKPSLSRIGRQHLRHRHA